MNKFIQLTEKYFEGQTSLEEEQLLRNYYRRKKVAAELEVYKPIFNCFSEEREGLQPVKKTAPKLMLWITTLAAACALLVFLLNKPQNTDNEAQSLAYVNGEKITDIAIIRAETLNSLANLAEGNNNICSSQVEALELFTDE